VYRGWKDIYSKHFIKAMYNKWRGSTNSIGTGNFDIYLIKTNSSGDTLWTNTFEGEPNDEGHWIHQTKDGGYIISGMNTTYGGMDENAFFIKTDSLGDSLWTRTMGGIGSEIAYCIQQTVDDGYILTGQTSSSGALGDDVWLIKTDINGDTIWTSRFGGYSVESAFQVQQTSDNGFILVGLTASFGAGSADVWLIKTAQDPMNLDLNITPLISDFRLF